ncbi:MAG TPA: hypothetical protein ENN07_05685 [candidate division Zixibacteria bacterium]|nr:hypothetical protein [candidate division Zixibacteria bacterium]
MKFFIAIITVILTMTMAEGFSFSYLEQSVPFVELEGNVASVSIAGCEYAMPGQYALPVRTINIALPAGTRSVSMDFHADEEVLLSGVDVEILREPELYAKWPFDYPEISPRAELVSNGMLFGVPIAQVSFRPVEFYPSTGTLTKIKSIRIDLTLESWNCEIILPLTSTRNSAEFRNRILDRFVVNPEALPERFTHEPMHEMEPRVRSFPPAPGDDPADGVAIIEERYLPAFEEFFHDEIAFGLSIEPISLEALYEAYPHGVDRAERIRRFIVDAYEKWGISGVFLAGEIEALPVRYRYGQMAIPTWAEVPSDLYFAVMDGDWNADGDGYFGEDNEDDYLPELMVGRFQLESLEEAEAYVRKLRAHRRELDRDFTRKWLFACASLSHTGSDRMGQSICDSIIDYHLPMGIDALKMFSRADSTGGDIELNSANFKSELELGRYFVCHIDHGYQYILHTGKQTGGGGLSIEDFLVMDNSPFFPLLYTYSCEVNAIDFNSVGAAMLRSLDGGAVATIAHSRPAWTSQINIVYSFWISNILPYPSIKIGEILKNTILEFPDNNIYRYYKSITTLFGYPFIDMFPQGLTEIDLAVTPDTIRADETAITAIVTNSITSVPIEDVSVVARTPSGKFAIAYTNESGIARLIIRPGDVEFVYVSAFGNGGAFIEETLAVVEAEGAYIVIEEATFREIGGDGDFDFEPGDTFACDLQIRNYGTLAAESVVVSLVSPEGIDVESFLGYLPAGDTATIVGAFSIAAPPNARGMVNVRPVVEVYAGGSSYLDTLSIILKGPVFTHFSTEYSGTVDGMPFPGDTGYISIGVTNTGWGDFHGGDAFLLLDGAIPETDSFFVGTFAPEDTVIITAPVVVEASALTGMIIFSWTNATPETIHFERRLPPAPHSLEMRPSVTSIQLIWIPPTGTEISGYNVYRKDFDGAGEWRRLNNLPLKFSTYIDEGLPEVTRFFYRVTAVDAWMNEGPPSDSILAWTTLPLLEGWPRSVGASIRIYASPVLFDVDGDGADEVFVMGQNYCAGFAFHANGEDVFDFTPEIDPFAVSRGAAGNLRT